MTGAIPGEPRLALVLPLLGWLALSCQSGTKSSPSTGAGGLLDGPTRWLMLPEEHRQAQRLRTTREAVAFIESFWRRRDPDPGAPGNEFARQFYERVDAADRLYSEDGERGSLTDRGRALVLLGPPPILRYNRKRLPAWEPGKPGNKPAIQSRTAMVEVWAYPLQDLPPALAHLIAEEEPGREQIELSFLEEGQRTSIIEGEPYLEMAVQAAVRDLNP